MKRMADGEIISTENLKKMAQENTNSFKNICKGKDNSGGILSKTSTGFLNEIKNKYKDDINTICSNEKKLKDNFDTWISPYKEICNEPVGPKPGPKPGPVGPKPSSKSSKLSTRGLVFIITGLVVFLLIIGLLIWYFKIKN
jgi:hypothetical protein